MSETWGKGTLNNTIGWGQGACDNSINWGKSQKDSSVAASWSGDTDISGCDSTDTFPFKIQLDLSGQTFPYTFQIQAVTAPSVTTDWGDGSTEVLNLNGLLSHTYTDSAITEPIITFGNKTEGNSLSQFKVNNFGSKNEIKDLLQWGEGNWTDNLQFRSCHNMTVSATDKPIGLGGTTGTKSNQLFYDARSVNPANINDWDISGVTAISDWFFQAVAFNQDLNKWDISNITSLGTLKFRGTSVFNGNIDNWDISGIISGSLSSMFHFSYRFNRDISTKSISAEDSPTGLAYTAWDLGNNPNITSLNFMFTNATDFNQDITNWDTSNITSMQQTFLNAVSFNQNIGLWDVSSVTDMYFMVTESSFNHNCSNWNLNTGLTRLDRFGFGNALSDDNWTDSLVGWAVSTYKNSGPYNVSSTTNNSVNFIDSKTSDTASGQTYAAKYGSDWTNTGWTDSTDARDFLITATGSGGAGWNITGD